MSKSTRYPQPTAVVVTGLVVSFLLTAGAWFILLFLFRDSGQQADLTQKQKDTAGVLALLGFIACIATTLWCGSLAYYAVTGKED